MKMTRSTIQSFTGSRRPDFRALFCLYLICIVSTHDYIEIEVKIITALLSFLGLLFPVLRSKASLWFCFTPVLASQLISSYATVANHYFLTIYTALMLGTMCLIESRDEKPSVNMARGLLAVVFGFATFHKIQSSYFRTGRLLGDYFFEGDSLTGTLGFWIPGFKEEFIPAYKGSIHTLLNGNILLNEQVAVPEISGGLILFCQLMAWSVIAVELLLFVGIIWNKSFYSRFMPALFLVFIWGTFCFRNERAFFSLASILFLFSSPHLKPHWIYAVTASILILLSLELGGLWISL